MVIQNGKYKAKALASQSGYEMDKYGGVEPESMRTQSLNLTVDSYLSGACVCRCQGGTEIKLAQS